MKTKFKKIYLRNVMLLAGHPRTFCRFLRKIPKEKTKEIKKTLRLKKSFKIHLIVENPSSKGINWLILTNKGISFYHGVTGPLYKWKTIARAEYVEDDLVIGIKLYFLKGRIQFTEHNVKLIEIDRINFWRDIMLIINEIILRQYNNSKNSRTKGLLMSTEST